MSMAQTVLASVKESGTKSVSAEAKSKIEKTLNSNEGLIGFGAFRPAGNGTYVQVFYSSKAASLAELSVSEDDLKFNPLNLLAKSVALTPDKVSLVDLSPVLKKPILSLLMTTKGDVDKETWLIRSDFKASAFSSLLLKRTGLATLITDQRGNLVLSSGADFEVAPPSAFGLLSNLTSDVTEGTDEQGHSYLGAYRKLNVENAAIFVEGEEQLITASFTHLIYRLFLVGVIVFGLSFIMAFLFSNRVLTHLRAIFYATERVAACHFDVPPEVETHDELGILAFAFKKMMAQLQDRDRLKNTLAKLPNAETVNRVLSGEMKLPTERKNIAVLVCSLKYSRDLYDSSLRPDEVIRTIGDFQNDVTRAIQKNQGIIDKVGGHTIRAVWLAVGVAPDVAYSALATAVEVRKAMKHANSRRQSKDLMALDYSIGIHTGEAIAGHLGYDGRNEYTFVGDAVETAYLTELAGRALDKDIVLSESAFKSLKNRSIPVGDSLTAQIPGFLDATVVFEALGGKNDGKKEEKKKPDIQAEPTSIIVQPNAHHDVGPQLQQPVQAMSPPPVQSQAQFRGQPAAPTQVFNFDTTRVGGGIAVQNSSEEPLWFLMRDAKTGATEGPLTLLELAHVTRQPHFEFDKAYAYRDGDAYMTPLVQVPGLSRRSDIPPALPRDMPPLPRGEQPKGAEEEWYIFGQDNRTYGPYVLAQLSQALEFGQMTRTTYCWRHGLSQWIFAYQVPGLDRRQSGSQMPRISVGKVS
ncbi:unnamed protein product [Sphagnum balticum]